MEEKIGINLIIEKEKQGSDIVFIVSSSDVNVFVEGKNIDEAKEKFIEGVKHHLEAFPEEKEALIKKEKSEMPMVQRIFL